MIFQVGPATVATFPPMLVVPSTGMGYAAMPMYPAAPQHMAPPHMAPRAHMPPPPQQPPVTPEQLQQVSPYYRYILVS